MFGPNTVIGTPSGGQGVVFTGSGTTRLSGSFANGPYRVAGGLTKTGPGQLIFDGDGTVLQGHLTLNGGTLTLDYTTNTATKIASGGLRLSGGILSLLAPASGVNDAASGTLLAANHNEISVAAGAAGLELGPITRSAGATLNFSGAPGTFLAVGTSTGNTNGLLGAGPAYATASGISWSTTSNGAATYLPTSSYGSDTYTAGTNTDYVGPFRYLSTNTTTNSIRFNVGGNNELDLLGASLTLQSGGILMTPTSGPVLIQSFYGGETLTAGGTGELLVHQYNNNNALAINANIVTSGGLTKAELGNLILGGANTGLTGPINVNQGSLIVTQPAAVNSASTINLNDNSGNAQYLSFDLGNYVYGAVSTNIRLGGSPGFGTGSSTNSTVTLSGVISSIPGQAAGVSFGLGINAQNVFAYQDNTSGFNLTNINTFVGNVFLLQGSLGINSNASLGNAANPLILAVGTSTAGGLAFLNSGVNLARPVEVVGQGERIKPCPA